MRPCNTSGYIYDKLNKAYPDDAVFPGDSREKQIDESQAQARPIIAVKVPLTLAPAFSLWR